MPSNYGFTVSLTKFFATVIMLISILTVIIGLVLYSFSALILRVIGVFFFVSGGLFFVIAAYVLIRVIVQYGNFKE